MDRPADPKESITMVGRNEWERRIHMTSRYGLKHNKRNCGRPVSESTQSNPYKRIDSIPRSRPQIKKSRDGMNIPYEKLIIAAELLK
jgi:hypothetical protein